MAKFKGLIIPNVGEDVVEMELSYTSGGNLKCYSHFGEHFGSFLNSSTYTYDPSTTLLLDILPREMKGYVHKKTCSQKLSS